MVSFARLAACDWARGGQHAIATPLQRGVGVRWGGVVRETGPIRWFDKRIEPRSWVNAVVS